MKYVMYSHLLDRLICIDEDRLQHATGVSQRNAWQATITVAAFWACYYVVPIATTGIYPRPATFVFCVVPRADKSEIAVTLDANAITAASAKTAFAVE